jgi:hypothetical protein
MRHVPTDSTTTTAVVAALAGGAGVFLGAGVTAFLGERARREEQRREQQRADAAVIGPVMAFLTDAEPDRLGMNVRSDMAEQQKVMLPLAERVNGIYGSLLVLSAGHPDERVSDLARKLAVAARNAFGSASFLVSDLVRHSGVEMRDQAKADHETARKLADELVAEIARYGRRRPRRGGS